MVGKAKHRARSGGAALQIHMAHHCWAREHGVRDGVERLARVRVIEGDVDAGHRDAVQCTKDGGLQGSTATDVSRGPGGLEYLQEWGWSNWGKRGLEHQEEGGWSTSGKGGLEYPG